MYKGLFAVTAVLAFIAIFYIGGLYEQYLISDMQFAIRFSLLAAAFIYSAGQAGAFDKPQENKMTEEEFKEVERRVILWHVINKKP